MTMIGAVRRVIPVKEGEVGPVLLATAYGFCILLSYNILRPVRDEISAADRGNLQILWTVVFLVMVFVAVPLYSAAVSRYSRGVFIPLVNRFFAVNLLLFFGALYTLPESARPWIDRVFYVWTSVFALFVVTVFWGFVVDLFGSEQGKRTFGLIAVGASLGGVVGAASMVPLAEIMPVFLLLIIAMLPLEVAARIARVLHRWSGGLRVPLRKEDPDAISGTILSSMKVVFASPYLRNIALFIALMTFASTILYYQQADLMLAYFPEDRAASRSFLASINTAVQAITLLTQGFVTAHFLRRFGIGISLAFVPAVACVGFSVFSVRPVLIVFIVVQVLYSAGRYALTKPSREVLFTQVSRDERYKSKSFIDAAVYRGGDLGSAWAYTGLTAIGLSLGSIALVAVVVAAVWGSVGLVLGRMHQRDSAASAA